jgi:hypothetical protein
MGERLVLDVQPIIPLPEAERYTTGLRQKVAEAATSDQRDWTAYIVITPERRSEPLRKRQAIRELATAIHRAGNSGETIAAALPGRSRMLAVDGLLEPPELEEAFLARYPATKGNLGRWFLDSPMQDHDLTWVITKMWGAQTEDVLSALVALVPGQGFGYEAVPAAE